MGTVMQYTAYYLVTSLLNMFLRSLKNPSFTRYQLPEESQKRKISMSHNLIGCHPYDNSSGCRSLLISLIGQCHIHKSYHINGIPRRPDHMNIIPHRPDHMNIIHHRPDHMNIIAHTIISHEH